MAKCEGLGSGLYPTAALFNHSCHPNIMRVNVGRRMVSPKFWFGLVRHKAGEFSLNNPLF